MVLIAWSRVFLQKLTGCQLFKKIPTFYGTRRFTTPFTSARHLSLSWANYIQSIHPISRRSILLFYSHLRLVLPSGFFPPGFPTKTLYMPLLTPYVPHAPSILFFSILSPEHYWVRSTDHSAPHCVLFSTPLSRRPSQAQITYQQLSVAFKD
jgi:hypothetical protein